jgi:hypothetical protein
VTTTTLSRYYRAVDEGRIDDALSMLDEKVAFVITLPAGTRRGVGRVAMGGYLSGRGVGDRAHVVLRQSRDGDVEFVYGRVTEGGATTGHFLATAYVGPTGLVGGYQVTFETEQPLVEDAGATPTCTPFLEGWFAIMDSDSPERVLDLISEDFAMSVQFSKGAGHSAEFVGDRAGLVAYLEQREKSVLVHHITQGARADDVELALGRTTRDGTHEASFNASALLDPTTGRCRRLLICRTPELEFPDT